MSSPNRPDRIRALFEAVVGLDPEERAAHLAEARGDDGELRREVESLLEAEDARGSGVRRALEGLQPSEEADRKSSAPSGPDEIPAALQPALADRYTLVREIGRGGMATVYLADDLKHPRQVAIKVMDPDLSEALGAGRFLGEIETASSLTHPHILPLYDSGEAEGLLYYVMPYVEGESLRHRLKRENQLPVEDAVRIAREIAGALQYAHDRGVIHRDVKPANILLEAGHAVLSDFGIAKAVAGVDRTHITQRGTSLGTPAYMSPEQMSGDQQLDGRSDQYALGCVLYEMLAGQPPHQGPNLAAIVARMMAGPAPSVRKLRSDVPEAVERALGVALEREPEDRYATVVEFGTTLTGEDVRPVRTGARRRSRGWRATWAGLAVLLVGTAGWWASATFGPGPDTIGWLAVLEPENHMGDPAADYLVAGTHTELIARLRRIPGLNVTGRQSALAHKGATVQEIARELNVDAVVTSQMTRVGDSVRVSAQLIEAFPRERQIWEGVIIKGSEDHLALYGEIALGIADQVQTTLTPEQRVRVADAPPVDHEAFENYVKGNEASYQPGSYRQAAQYFQRAIDLESEWAPPYAGLAAAYVDGGTWWGDLSPDSAWRLASPLVARAIELDESSGEAHMVLGAARSFLEWDWLGADSGFGRGMELGGVSSPAQVQYMNFLTAMGRADDAIVIGKGAVEADPLYPAVHNELAWALLFAGREDEALERFQVSLELDPNFRQTHELLIQLHLKRGNIHEALAEAEILQVLSPGFPPSAVALAGAGRTEEARAVLDSAESGLLRATALVALGESDEAVALVQRLYERHSADMAWLREYFNLFFEPLHDDSRLLELIRKVDYPDWSRADPSGPTP
jgi:serine/threonine-protein kinase